MQHLKEFLTRVQTFDLRVIEEDILMEWGMNEKEHVKVYDLSHQTQYYDSFSYRSELRVLKDMAFIESEDSAITENQTNLVRARSIAGRTMTGTLSYNF